MIGLTERCVAPRAGAWIETIAFRRRRKWSCVAPRAGAWIETLWGCPFAPLLMSHPVRVRGLKPSYYSNHTIHTMSHPVRVRGLKQDFESRLDELMKSHPVRVRGLKLVSD